MSSEISEDQLIHYFAGECSDEEAARIETWINADPDRERRVSELRQIWDAAKSQPNTGRNVHSIWKDLTRRLASFDDKTTERSRKSVGKSSHRRSRRRWRSSKLLTRSSSVSAVVLGIVALGLILWVFYNAGVIDRGDASMSTIATDVGQHASVELGDGSKVMLNTDSRLELPPEFGDEKREVTLVGEAYFEVVPENRPFLVRAGGSVTKVLGTEFAVGSYPEEERVRVVVVKGEVAVRDSSERSGSSIALRDRQMASLSKVDDMVLRREVDPTRYLAWTEGKLVFNDAPFDEVSRRLRRWYGLQVELVGSVEATDRLNATFTDEPLSEVLTIIAETLDLEYKRHEERVTFVVPD